MSGKKLQGFTIVELIIVIAVIGILASIGLISWSGAQNRAKKSSFESTAQQVKLKLGEYFTDNNRYPSAKTGTGSVCDYLNNINATSLYTEFCTGPKNTAYVYTASPTSPACTTACTSYTISVAKSNWSGDSGDTNISITP